MSNNNENTVQTLIKGMEHFLTTKTVVGEPIYLNETIILPLSDVSFGIGAGSFVNGAKDNNCGGMGGKMSPSAILVIKDGNCRLVNVKNQDTMSKLIDMVPDVVSKFTSKEKTDEEVIEEIAKEV